MSDQSDPAGLPLVSVIVATNRGGPFLSEALRSVADQTHPRVEVIVIDDGAPDPESIDLTAQIVPDAAIVHRPASGVSTARNLGAALSTGEFLVFLDDDDRWHRERLELQLAAFRAHPAAGVGYCSMQSIDEHGDVIAAADQIAVQDERDIARRNTGIIRPNLMIRRTAWLRSGGFDPQIRLAEDLDLILTLARTESFAFAPETLVDYRAHAGSTTRRYRELSRSIDLVVKAHRRSAKERKDEELVRAHEESLRANRRFAWWSAMRAYRRDLSEGHRAAAIGDLAWAVRFAPFAPAEALARRVRRAR